jgi:mannose-1-phosphate guanylyltransferase
MTMPLRGRGETRGNSLASIASTMTTRDVVRRWSVVMAGGEGNRLQSLVERVCGDSRPKQFAPLMGSRSLLQQTLARVRLRIPERQTIVCGLDRHASHLAGDVRGSDVRVLLQPSNRGTAAGLLWPVYWIHQTDPGALVIAMPSDHFVYEDRRFMDHLLGVSAFLEEHPQWLVLVGARPAEPDSGYGWIERAESLDSQGPETVWRVRQFVEKPNPEMARACFARGHLWNTFVVMGRTDTFINAARFCVPDVHAALSDAARHAGTERERESVEGAYRGLPVMSFSDAVLAAPFPRLATSCLPPLLWSDLGTPERLLRTAIVLTMMNPRVPPAPAGEARRDGFPGAAWAAAPSAAPLSRRQSS